ncbi:sigma-70 family RNA polymerase sigma factor [Clostridium sp. D2Q-11]|uniref:Sigma-70 family RNA polymerase sigma factor n=1 Tax=Anaeromonas frigoriresistens TaxID=2683708 RepID=A0A942US04_9FIRM|nr:sigma-70 family RNA polymerase sigma factor [Anaeromonas frigoriresistens]MBS4536835.1 sigma-70 family RNA polymerase sigma factor [Anaeromonas frigoriresistens]
MQDILVKKAKKGDKDSFSKIIQEVKDQAYRVAYCYLHNEEDSMDAVCDAIEKAYNNIKKLKHPKYFKTWFIRIVINECKKQITQKNRVIYVADEIYKEDIKDNKDDKLDIEALLKELPELERSLIYMKYYLGYTLLEISEIVSLPEGTVKSKIYNNLKKMKTRLEIREV